MMCRMRLLPLKFHNIILVVLITFLVLLVNETLCDGLDNNSINNNHIENDINNNNHNILNQASSINQHSNTNNKPNNNNNKHGHEDLIHHHQQQQYVQQQTSVQDHYTSTKTNEDDPWDEDSTFSSSSSYPSSSSSFLPEENGLLILSSRILTDTDRYARNVIFPYPEQQQQEQLMLLLIHDPDCPYSRNMLQRVEEASQLMRMHWENNVLLMQPQRSHHTPYEEHTDNNVLSKPRFAKLQVSTSSSGGSAGSANITTDMGALLREYSITSIPTLMFVSRTTTTTTIGTDDSSQQQQQDRQERTTVYPNGSTEAQQHAHKVDLNEPHETSSSFGPKTTTRTATLLLEYTGLSETPVDVFRTVLHYYMRLVLSSGGMVDGSGSGSGSGSTNSQEEYIQLQPKRYSNVPALQSFLQQHAQSFLLPYSNIPQGMNRKAVYQGLTSQSQQQLEQEIEYLQWLLQEDNEGSVVHGLGMEDGGSNTGKVASLIDDFVVVAQCRPPYDRSPSASSSSEEEEDMLLKERQKLYDRFDQMSRALSHRRDRFYATMERCQGQVPDGGVMVWRLPVDLFQKEQPQQYVQDHLWGTIPQTHWYDPNPDRLMEFLVKVCTPSIMVLDRQATAPIAFAMYRKVHAALVVDTRMLLFATAIDKQVTRQAVRRFRRTCQRQQRESLAMTYNAGIEGSPPAAEDMDMVCLIIPSTETRVLMALGVDLWGTSSKNKSSHGTSGTRRVDQLPMMLLTDQRPGSGTKRYYLDHEEIDTMDDFVRRFWQGQLSPDIKTDPRGPRTNTAGVRILTADSLQHELFSSYHAAAAAMRERNETAATAASQTHAMIAFVSPTCGHCKRFLVLWNRLSEFLNHVGWGGSIIKLYRMDVSINELAFHNLTVRWLPDLYYLHPPPVSHNHGDKQPHLDEADALAAADERTINLMAEQRMIRYDWKDEMGDDAAMDDTMDFVQWFLAVANLTDAQLKELFDGLSQFD